MPAVGKFMVRPFNAHLIKRADWITNRHMEGICIVRFIGHAGNNAVLLAVDTDKSSGKPFCRRCNKAEIQIIFIAVFIYALTHITDNFLPQLLRFFAFALMFANQRSKRFGKADKTNGKRTVFNCRLNAVILFKFIAAHIKPLAHQKRQVAHTQVALHTVTVIKLLRHKVHHIVKHLIELVYIAFCLNG